MLTLSWNIFLGKRENIMRKRERERVKENRKEKYLQREFVWESWIYYLLDVFSWI